MDRCRGGHPDEGIEEIHKGQKICETRGAALIRPYFLILLAEACRGGERLEQGRAALAETLASMEKSGERAYEAEMHRLHAEFLVAEGDEAEAERLLRSAIITARLQKALSLELRATSTLARLLGKHNRREEARAMLMQIYNWFTEGFSTVALQEARSLLEQLE